RARGDYLRRYHDVDWLDPTLYHLVVNTASLPAPAIVNLIVTAQKAVKHVDGAADVDEAANA
ncbi:MAG: hypothetical protein ACK2UA_08125, partial [Anaerolineae bacterium]